MANPTVTLVGRVGQEPEAIGSNGLRFRMATNDRVKNDVTGEWEDKNTSWWTIKAWRKLAEQCQSVIKKGQEIIVLGKVFEESWTDKDGNKRTSYEVNAEYIAVSAFSLSKVNSDNKKDEDFPSYKTYAEVPF